MKHFKLLEFIDDINSVLKKHNLCVVVNNVEIAGHEFIKLKEFTGWSLETAEQFYQRYMKDKNQLNTWEWEQIKISLDVYIDYLTTHTLNHGSSVDFNLKVKELRKKVSDMI